MFLTKKNVHFQQKGKDVIKKKPLAGKLLVTKDGKMMKSSQKKENLVKILNPTFLKLTFSTMNQNHSSKKKYMKQ